MISSQAFGSVPLTYTLGSDLNQTIVGQSFQTFTRGTLSITSTGRPVDITMVSDPTSSGGYIQLSSLQFVNTIGYLRVLRGPSTIIGTENFLLTPAFGTTPMIAQFPCSMFTFTDFTPPVGAATYILQANAIGTSVTVTGSGALMYVRQT